MQQPLCDGRICQAGVLPTKYLLAHDDRVKYLMRAYLALYPYSVTVHTIVLFFNPKHCITLLTPYIFKCDGIHTITHDIM